MVSRFAIATIDLLCLLHKTEMTASAIANVLNIDNTKELKRKILFPLIDNDFISMTLPDKPTSAKQAYRLTPKGRNLFKLL